MNLSHSFLNSGTFLASTMSCHKVYRLIMWWMKIQLLLFAWRLASSGFIWYLSDFVQKETVISYLPFPGHSWFYWSLAHIFSAFHNKNLYLFYCSSYCDRSVSLTILAALICIFYSTSVSVFRWYVTINTIEDVDVSCTYTTAKRYFMFLIPFVVIPSILFAFTLYFSIVHFCCLVITG